MSILLDSSRLARDVGGKGTSQYLVFGHGRAFYIGMTNPGATEGKGWARTNQKSKIGGGLSAPSDVGETVERNFPF